MKNQGFLRPVFILIITCGLFGAADAEASFLSSLFKKKACDNCEPPIFSVNEYYARTYSRAHCEIQMSQVDLNRISGPESWYARYRWIGQILANDGIGETISIAYTRPELTQRMTIFFSNQALQEMRRRGICR